MTVGTSPEDAHTRRIVVEVVSNTLAIAMERAGDGDVFGHMMAVLDEAKDPTERETPPADEIELRKLVVDGITAARSWRCGPGGHLAPTGALLHRLAVHLSNEMLDAQDMRSRLANLSDRANDAIIRTIDARLSRLAGQVAPDESHPAEGVVEALKDELVAAVMEALR